MVGETASRLAARSTPKRLARFAWAVLAYNLLVILWGAFVRASGSGAGCGRHWPLCNGEVVPQPKTIATIIEATHRATSGLALIAVVALAVWTFRALPRGHRARRLAFASTAFILVEALLGAGLVLFELVAHDASLKRGLSMVLHLGNTFLMLGALTLTAWTITFDGTDAPAEKGAPGPALHTKAARLVMALALGAVLVLGASGAIAALGDTLFPARSLREGLSQDLSPLAHVFLRLRVLHPFLALGTGLLVFVAASFALRAPRASRVKMLSRVVTIIFATQFAAGLLNVTLLAPLPMQLVHLLLADATWLALVLMGWEALYPHAARLAASPRAEPFQLLGGGFVGGAGGLSDQSPIMSRKGPAPTSDVPPSTSNVDPVT